MNLGEKLLKMYIAAHGDIDTRTGCNIVPYEKDYDKEEHDVDYEEDGVLCLKDGRAEWFISKSDLVFDYVTLNW